MFPYLNIYQQVISDPIEKIVIKCATTHVWGVELWSPRLAMRNVCNLTLEGGRLRNQPPIENNNKSAWFPSTCKNSLTQKYYNDSVSYFFHLSAAMTMLKYFVVRVKVSFLSLMSSTVDLASSSVHNLLMGGSTTKIIQIKLVIVNKWINIRLDFSQFL